KYVQIDVPGKAKSCKEGPNGGLHNEGNPPLGSSLQDFALPGTSKSCKEEPNGGLHNEGYFGDMSTAVFGEQIPVQLARRNQRRCNQCEYDAILAFIQPIQRNHYEGRPRQIGVQSRGGQSARKRTGDKLPIPENLPIRSGDGT